MTTQQPKCTISLLCLASGESVANLTKDGE